MGLIVAVVAILGGIIVAVVTSLLTSELQAWSPRLVEWLIRRAVRRLPTELQQRMKEEWHAFIEETPGQLVKIMRAWGLTRGAQRIADAEVDCSFAERAASRVFGALTFFVSAPVILVIIALLTPERPPGPVLVRVRRRLRRAGSRSAFSPLQLRIGAGPVSRWVHRTGIRDIPAAYHLLVGEHVITWAVWRQMIRSVATLLTPFRSG